MNLNKEEIQLLMYALDLVIQSFGENEKLENLWNKLKEMTDNV